MGDSTWLICLSGPEQAGWLNRLETKHDNLRAALAWSAAPEEAGEAGLRLAGALWLFWRTRGYAVEGRNHIESALERTPSQTTVIVAKALAGVGNLAGSQGDLTAAQAYFEKSLAISRALGDSPLTASVPYNLGIVASRQGKTAAARELYESCLVIGRGLGDANGAAMTLLNLGTLANGEGDYAAARSHYEESLPAFRELKNGAGIVMALNGLGIVAYGQGDYDKARALHKESLAMSRALTDEREIANALGHLSDLALREGDSAAARDFLAECLSLLRDMHDEYLMAFGLENLAAVSLGESQIRRAVVVWAAAGALRERIAIPLLPHDAATQNAQLDEARSALGAAAFAAA